MIDFHTHILPHMDDGSKSVTESLEMMELLKQQGIDTLVASPHFYSHWETIPNFLMRRKAAWNLLSQFTGGRDLPDVLLGAEVAFFQGMSKVADLNQLRIGDSEAILLEMPFSNWTTSTISEIFNLINNSNLTPIIAHAERYPDFVDGSGKLADLISLGAIFQFNADHLTTLRTRRKALDLIRKQDCYVLGSDCHNLTTRVPRLGEAMRLVEKKLGPDRLDQMDEMGRNLLNVNS